MICEYNNKDVETCETKKKVFSILIVDDDVDIAENLKILLQMRGHNIIVVDDGVRCIGHCKDRSKHYDIIFLDYHMEGLDGAQVAEIVKDGYKKTIIFAYTGDSSQSALDDFKSVGMDGVIIKPIDITGIDILMTNLEKSNFLDKHTIKTISRKSDKSILIFDEITIS